MQKNVEKKKKNYNKRDEDEEEGRTHSSSSSISISWFQKVAFTSCSKQLRIIIQRSERKNEIIIIIKIE